MSKIADANYTLRATAEEGEAFQVLGGGDYLSSFFLSSRGLSQVLDTNSGHAEDTGADVSFTSRSRLTAAAPPCAA